MKAQGCRQARARTHTGAHTRGSPRKLGSSSQSPSPALPARPRVSISPGRGAWEKGRKGPRASPRLGRPRQQKECKAISIYANFCSRFTGGGGVCQIPPESPDSGRQLRPAPGRSPAPVSERHRSPCPSSILPRPVSVASAARLRAARLRAGPARPRSPARGGTHLVKCSSAYRNAAPGGTQHPAAGAERGLGSAGRRRRLAPFCPWGWLPGSLAHKAAEALSAILAWAPSSPAACPPLRPCCPPARRLPRLAAPASPLPLSLSSPLPLALSLSLSALALPLCLSKGSSLW